MEAHLERRGPWLARALFALALGTTGVALAMHVTTGERSVADEWGLPGFEGLLALTLAMVGFVIARRTSNPTGWIFSVMGAVSGIQYLTEQYATAALGADSTLPGAVTVAWVAEWIWVPLIAGIGFLLLVFPDDRIELGPGRVIASMCTLAMVSTFLVAAFMAPRVATWDVPNPYSVSQDARLYDIAFSVSASLLMLSLVAGAVRLVARLRRATGVRRQQLKWFVYASVFASVSMVFSAIPATLEVGSKLAVLGIIGLAVASAVAVLRYRLYDIDVVINRTLVYGALSAVLAALYVGLVIGFEAILSPFTADSDLAVAGSTLAVAALFRPARSRIQGFIDRRFYRRKFDADRTVAEFSSHLRDEVDLMAVIEQLTGVVQDTMQPRHISLWMRT